MIAIEVAFLANRFHATPWDHQVNEGVVEWPPSPWRFARGLIATWHHKAAGEVSEASMRALIDVLAEPPAFHLPAATIAHTRHYMPLKNLGESAKIFDTFVQTETREEDGEPVPLVMVWQDATLTEALRHDLELLVGRTGYLGRAESWVEARLLPEGAWSGTANARPLFADAVPGPREERVKLLVPESPERLMTWRARTLDMLRARRLAELQARDEAKGKERTLTKLPKKELEALERELPNDLFGALHVDVGELKKAGWSQAPGTRWISYARPMDAFHPRRRQADLKPRQVCFARYAVKGPVYPRLLDAVRFGEWFRMAAMSQSKRVEEEQNASAIFSGKNPDGTPAKGGHWHAYYLSEACGDKGQITHVTVYTSKPEGFNSREQMALEGIRKVWGPTQDTYEVVLLEMGGRMDLERNPRASAGTQLGNRSTIWQSTLPFVPTRFLRSDNRLNEYGEQIDGIADQVRRELVYHGIAEEVVTIEPFKERSAWSKFRLVRTSGNGHRGGHGGYGVKITFKQPVQGPVAIGYGAHFGLGLFEAIKDEM